MTKFYAIPVFAFIWTASIFAAPTSQPVTIRDSKTLNKLSNTLHDTTVSLAPGHYDWTPKLIEWQNVLFKAQDENNPPDLRIAAKDAGRWAFNTDAKTFNSEIRHIHATLPDSHGGFLHATGGDAVRLVGCYQNEGNVFWSEGKGGRFLILNHVPGSAADKYEICNFTAPIDELIVDERGVPNALFLQNPKKTEACIRDMQSKHSVYLGVHVETLDFKFGAQDRGGGFHEWIQCIITHPKKSAPYACVTIGWMAASAGIPVIPLLQSSWTDCVMDGYSQENKTCKLITFLRCTINGKLTTATIRN